ncbi:MAG: hypothetical protein JJU16_10350 [Alkalibacterium sp.]|nr:hypothetical protein [Alkalibacterium sp.]
MSELLGRLIIISLAWAGIIHNMIQMRRIVIRHTLTGIFSKRSTQLAAAVILVALAIVFNLTFIDWVVVFSAALVVYLSQYNKGFTSSGVIPIESGTAVKGMMSREYTFKETQQWLILDQQDRLQLCFTTVNAPDDIKLIYFDKRDKEAILSILSQHNQNVKVAKD